MQAFKTIKKKHTYRWRYSQLWQTQLPEYQSAGRNIAARITKGKRKKTENFYAVDLPHPEVK